MDQTTSHQWVNGPYMVVIGPALVKIKKYPKIQSMSQIAVDSTRLFIDRKPVDGLSFVDI